MPVLVLRLKAPRRRFAQMLTDTEREIMARHGAHWRPYLERGDMVAFGPVLTDEDSYGLAVVETRRRAGPAGFRGRGRRRDGRDGELRDRPDG